jgi:hypothetical protein
MLGPVQVAAGDCRQSLLRYRAKQLPPVEGLNTIEEPAQLAPVPREVVRGERDGWPTGGESPEPWPGGLP